MLNWGHHNSYDEPSVSSSSGSSSVAANLSSSYNSDSRNQGCMGGGNNNIQYGTSIGGGNGGGGGYGDYSPHMDPINMMSMDDQEKKKLERKRARNRQAASKCRQKKMDRIKELEDQVLHEKHRGQRLDAELVELNRALANFRQMVERHSNTGCPNNSIRA
ncbi:Protein CBG03270, isoform b [Caenorhabditis briggsae]|uniref:Protein CBG03270, isoform b n=2 Tax=Caenorhabditis briggsae TaxID=6238 RepID=H8WH97_CAEBR|nr:Protein CBG03270, isoform b [Caenorhabditis briggsae]ULU05523.1 hypothetical protein L3Y34_017881 [Caenorhabditis briggsae]CCG58679.1 Protein CBG03270, isoform b [Caenorhabditis briggsae]